MLGKNGFQFGSKNTIVGIIFMAVAVFALFWIARGIFTLLAYVAPVLLIITLFINHKIVLNYGKWLWKQLNNNPVMGVVAILLTVVGFPIVSFMLFGRALLQRKVEKMQDGFDQERAGDFTDFEVLEDEAPLQLPPLKEPEPRQETGAPDQDYEQLFD